MSNLIRCVSCKYTTTDPNDAHFDYPTHEPTERVWNTDADDVLDGVEMELQTPWNLLASTNSSDTFQVPENAILAFRAAVRRAKGIITMSSPTGHGYRTTVQYQTG